MVFNQSPRVARPVNTNRPGAAYDLARAIASWAVQRDQDAPVHPQESRAEVAIADENGSPTGLFFLTGGDVDELRQKLLGYGKEV